MGNRVAKMVYPDGQYPMLDQIGWCCYQSTSMSCFGPIFHNQLAAHCFAHVLGINFPQWSDSEQEEMAASVNDFIREKFGDDPNSTESPEYWDALTAKDLPICDEFIEWRVAKRKASEAKTKKET